MDLHRMRSRMNVIRTWAWVYCKLDAVSMDGIRMWFQWDATEHGCNQDVGQNDIVMGISGAWTSCCSGHFGHECIQNKVAHGLPSSWMHRASDALEHELSKCGQGCSVNPCASNRAKVWQGSECFSERDALQHGRGQDAGMNVDGTGCSREDVSKMWARTGRKGMGACCWGGKPSSMNVIRIWARTLWELDAVQHGFL